MRYASRGRKSTGSPLALASAAAVPRQGLPGMFLTSCSATPFRALARTRRLLEVLSECPMLELISMTPVDRRDDRGGPGRARQPVSEVAIAFGSPGPSRAPAGTFSARATSSCRTPDCCFGLMRRSLLARGSRPRVCSPVPAVPAVRSVSALDGPRRAYHAHAAPLPFGLCRPRRLPRAHARPSAGTSSRSARSSYTALRGLRPVPDYCARSRLTLGE